MIICITGLPAAGKSSVGRILAEHGYRVYELGDIVREMMREKGIRLNPDSDRRFTIWLHRQRDKLITVKRLEKKVGLSGKGKIAIVGFRSKTELDYMRKRGNSVAIAVLAPERLRFARMKKRARADAQKSEKEFRARDRKEAGFGIWGAIRSADYVIAGTGTIPQLRLEVEKVLEHLATRVPPPE